MKSLYYKVLDDKGRVLIPLDMRKTAELQDNDIMRMCVYNKMLIMERVELPPADLVGKLRQSLSHPEKTMPEDAVECFILAAVAEMSKNKQASLILRLGDIFKKEIGEDSK